ncbi:MAG: DNA recombination protein RmuC [Alphaproteobacteria bacterium]
MFKFSSLKQQIYELSKLNEQSISTMKSDLSSYLAQQQNNVTLTLSSNLESINHNLINLTKLNDSKFDALKTSIDDKLYKMQSDNADKLEKMRYTVEEKLQETLDNRLSSSFKIVSDHLEQVHKGLGEMQSLASGVGDIKKIFSNVKTRGIWGEIQLEAILEQMLSSQQYEKNAKVKESSAERVEFAIRLPTKDQGKYVLLPIDSKLPLEHYERLIDSIANDSIEQIEINKKALENSIKKQAKEIASKYINTPLTTEFAILFLPIEGLYAEVLSIPGLADTINREHKIVITGPTTLSALLSSLQIGYRAIAIEKRSTEVWKVLGTLKSEFSKFTSIISKTKEKLDQAVKVISTAESRGHMISQRLENIECDIDSVDTNDNDMILEPLFKKNGTTDDK